MLIQVQTHGKIIEANPIDWVQMEYLFLCMSKVPLKTKWSNTYKNLKTPNTMFDGICKREWYRKEWVTLWQGIFILFEKEPVGSLEEASTIEFMLKAFSKISETPERELKKYLDIYEKAKTAVIKDEIHARNFNNEVYVEMESFLAFADGNGFEKQVLHIDCVRREDKIVKRNSVILTNRKNLCIEACAKEIPSNEKSTKSRKPRPEKQQMEEFNEKFIKIWLSRKCPKTGNYPSKLSLLSDDDKEVEELKMKTFKDPNGNYRPISPAHLSRNIKLPHKKK